MNEQRSGEGLLSEAQMMQLVRRALRSVYTLLPDGVEEDDLLQIGYLACLEGMARFDPDRGIPVGGYLWPRVRGRIVDEGWRMLGLSRAHGRRRRRVEVTVVSSTQGAAGAGYSNLVHGRGTVLPAGGGAEALTAACYAARGCEMVQGRYGEPPERSIALGRQRRALRKAVRRLPEEDARVLKGLYIEDQSLREVSVAMGRSKSWVSRTHRRLIEDLREAIGVEVHEEWDDGACGARLARSVAVEGGDAVEGSRASRCPLAA